MVNSIAELRESLLLERSRGGAQHVPVPVRSLPDARAAYARRDVESSRQAHTSLREDLANQDLASYFHGGTAHEEEHSRAGGDIVKAIVFGGLDGGVTMFAVLAGCVGANITPVQAIVIGIGNLIADAFSMGFGEYVSSKAEEDYVAAEKTREQWELDNCPEGEMMEMMDIYRVKYGFSELDAEEMVAITFKYPKFFLAHMMVEELGLLIGDNDGVSAAFRGLAMFSSFAAFGLIPLLGFAGYLILAPASASNSNVSTAFAVACGMTLTTLFILGLLKAKFSSQNPWLSGLVMMFNGGLASTFAYASAKILQELINSWWDNGPSIAVVG